MPSNISSVSELIARIGTAVLNPLIALLFALALILFLWGGFQFIVGSGEAGEARESGKRHMLWGLIGLLVMVSVYGILAILGNTFGFSTPTP